MAGKSNRTLRSRSKNINTRISKSATTKKNTGIAANKWKTTPSTKRTTRSTLKESSSNRQVLGDKTEQILETTSISAGKFGWETVENTFIPYVLVYDEKYVCVRIVFETVLKKLELCFSMEVLQCIRFYGSPLTFNEAELFNEINEIHCDGLFGIKKFTQDDCKIKYTDFINAYNFFKYCYSFLVLQNYVNSKCGFLKTSQENIIPYVVRDDKKYTPVFYFEETPIILTLEQINFTNYEMFYLRLCCKIHGIRSEFYNVDSCKAIDVDKIIKYFPPLTTFAEYYPSFDIKKFVNPNLRVPTIINGALSKNMENNLPISSTSTPFILNKIPIVQSKVQFMIPQSSAPVPSIIMNALPINQQENVSRRRSDSPRFWRSNGYILRKENDPLAIMKRTVALEKNSGYQLCTKLVFSKPMTCINFKANDSSMLLVSVDEIKSKFFRDRSYAAIKEALTHSALDLYFPNPDQIKVLQTRQPYIPGDCFVCLSSLLQVFHQFKDMVENKI